MVHWKPFRSSLSFPAFARIRPIYSYFSGLRQSEKGEPGLSALLKRFMISHTHLKTSYLPDTTLLVKRPSNGQPSSCWETAPGLAGPRGSPKPRAPPHAPCQRPVQACLCVTGTPGAQQVCLMFHSVKIHTRKGTQLVLTSRYCLCIAPILPARTENFYSGNLGFFLTCFSS